MIKLKLYGKNWALLNNGKPLELETAHVPRVGEIIDVANEGDLIGKPTTFIVCDVTWLHENGRLIPYLKCHQWLKGDRQLELEEHGWTHGYSK